jgi:hypothetical protein
MKMLSPEVNLRLIAPKPRNVRNPWFKRGTLAGADIDTLRPTDARAGSVSARRSQFPSHLHKETASESRSRS